MLILCNTILVEPNKAPLYDVFIFDIQYAWKLKSNILNIRCNTIIFVLAVILNWKQVLYCDTGAIISFLV